MGSNPNPNLEVTLTLIWKLPKKIVCFSSQDRLLWAGSSAFDFIRIWNDLENVSTPKNVDKTVILAYFWKLDKTVFYNFRG